MQELPFWMKQRRNGYWYVWYRHRPGWISTRTKDEREARDIAWQNVDEAPPTNITLNAFAGDFFLPGKCPYERDERARGRTFASRYFREHRGRLVNYILPRWGSYILSAIKQRPVFDWLLDLADARTGEPLANETKNKILVCFRIVMDMAESLEHIEENPLRRVKLFVAHHKERRPFTIEELKRLFPTDREELMRIWQSQMWLTYFLALATTGWRPGEVAALRPANWYRSKQAVVTKHSIENATRSLKGLKTEKKGVKMKAAPVTDRLQQELLLREQELQSEEEFFFHTGDGRPLVSESANKHFRASCRRAGVPPGDRTQYSLRHAFSTDLHTVAPEPVVNKLMGHTRYRGEYDHRQELELIRGLDGVRDYIREIRDLAD